MTVRPKIPKPPSLGEETLARDLKAHKINFAREYVFHPGRKWRFDFALRPPTPEKPGIAVEVEGGLFVSGRHSRGKSYEADLEKYNQAANDYWLVLRYSTDMITSGEAITQILEILAAQVNAR